MVVSGFRSLEGFGCGFGDAPGVVQQAAVFPPAVSDAVTSILQRFGVSTEPGAAGLGQNFRLMAYGVAALAAVILISNMRGGGRR